MLLFFLFCFIIAHPLFLMLYNYLLDEEDEFDIVAFGKENTGERLYMNDITGRGSYLNLHNVMPNSMSSICNTQLYELAQWYNRFFGAWFDWELIQTLWALFGVVCTVIVFLVCLVVHLLKKIRRNIEHCWLHFVWPIREI